MAQITYWPFVARSNTDSYLSPTIGGAFGPTWMPIVFQPGVAFQFEDSNNVDKLGFGGETWRGKGILDLAFYPFADRLNGNDPSQIGPFEILLSYNVWWNLDASGGFATRDSEHEAFTVRANYYFGPYSDDLSQRPFAFGVDYVNGEDPEEGFDDDDYWMLGLKAMF